MTKIDWIIKQYKSGDTTQLIMFFENLLWAQSGRWVPNVESIEKYLLSEDGYSLNDMFENK